MAQSRQIVDIKSRTKRVASLKSELNSLLRGIKKFQKEKFSYWEEAVGEKISKVAVPVKNKKGVLFVKVEDAVWRFELTRRKEEILNRINQKLNKSTLKDIVFI